MREESEIEQGLMSSPNSELMRMDDSTCQPTANSQSAISRQANLRFVKSKGIHVGDQFVSVTQNVHKVEVVKGRFLGLELVSTKSTSQLRCSIAVFVCWAFVVSSGLAFIIYQIALAQRLPLELDIYEPWYLRRDDWQAMPPCTRDFLDLPLKYVIIGHSAYDYCTEKYSCIKSILTIQEDNLRRGWGDIGPNFLVTGNGIVFEGRGADVFPAMVIAWNRRSIMIMFMGDYRTDATDIVQFERVNLLLEELVRKQVLVPDYTVWAQCQVSPDTVSPGPKVMARMNLLPHWDPTNQSSCINME